MHMFSYVDIEDLGLKDNEGFHLVVALYVHHRLNDDDHT